MNKIMDFDLLFEKFGIGLSIFLYQLAFGLSLRYFENSLMFRVYLGPLKIWGYVKI